MLGDPFAPVICHTSGITSHTNGFNIFIRHVILRDHITTASIIPFPSLHHVPSSLLAYLAEQFNTEISQGDTYPYLEIMSVECFAAYWFENFGAIMLLDRISSINELLGENEWSKKFLGSFYIKPNYPGRSSHVCNAGFLVAPSARNRGVGRLLGEAYVEWAPKLGYIYSVFNLVYETNVASCRIWDSLGFKRIGRVKGAGNLRSYPGRLVDAIIFGRDLCSENEDIVSEERFDKIKFYLKYGRYPAGADRSEKSRLRSAATHYKFEPETDKLLLKDKEVISDPQRQYEITRSIHMQQHPGINKTTAIITEKYHWVRIKETVSLVIRNCHHCKELSKTPNTRTESGCRLISGSSLSATAAQSQFHGQFNVETSSNAQVQGQNSTPSHDSILHTHTHTYGQCSVSPQVLNHALQPCSIDIHNHQSQDSCTVVSDQNDYEPLDSQFIDLRTSHEDLHGNSHSQDYINTEVSDNHFTDDEIENDNLTDMLGVGDHHSQESSPRASKEIEMSLSLEMGISLEIHESETVDSAGDLDMLMEDVAIDNSINENLSEQHQEIKYEDQELNFQLQAQAQAAVEATKEILIAAEKEKNGQT